jgi:methyl-accepting chemotaxis protein
MTKWLNMISNLKFTSKLLVSPVIAVLFLLIYGVVCQVGFVQQKQTLDDVFDNRIGNYELASGVLVGLNSAISISTEVQNVLAEEMKAGKGNEMAADAIRAQSADLSIVIGKIKDGADTLFKRSSRMTKEEKKYVDSIKGHMDPYCATLKGAVQAEGTDIGTASAKMADASIQFHSMSMFSDLQELLNIESQLCQKEHSKVSARFSFVLTLSFVILIAAMVLPFCVGILMKGIILRPISRTVETIEAVAQGDLTKRINVDSSDEIGEMAKHFNVFVENLGGTISHVIDSSNRVAQAAGQLDEATEKMAAGVEEAATQVNAVAAASEEMSKTSGEIAKNCVMAVKSSDEANKTVNVGESIIQDTIRVMGSISERVQDSAEIMKRLGARSDQIGEIVGLINDVADQTNLLALNAAIEAARAGEHGRGFAVVADEVRKLAERTSHATKEISETISAMQADTKTAVKSMEEGVTEVGSGTKEAARSGEALANILQQIGKVTGEINQIAVASEQETATTNEIASNIHQVSQVMQETAHQIQGNASASSELAGLSVVLKEMVSHFKVE